MKTLPSIVSRGVVARVVPGIFFYPPRDIRRKMGQINTDIIAEQHGAFMELRNSRSSGQL
jgi:hypothetical protein